MEVFVLARKTSKSRFIQRRVFYDGKQFVIPDMRDPFWAKQEKNTLKPICGLGKEQTFM